MSLRRVVVLERIRVRWTRFRHCEPQAKQPRGGMGFLSPPLGCFAPLAMTAPGSVRARYALAAAMAGSAAMFSAAMPATALADGLVHPDQSTPDSAAISPITAAFIAAVGPFNGFLEASDQLAAERAAGRTRAFAAREVGTRAALIAELESWAAGVRRARYEEAHAPTIDRLGPLFGVVDDPVNIVVVPADLRQRGDLQALATLDGDAFDALYATSQAGTLRQLENAYVDYIKNGDDQVLRALSVRDLPRVRSLLAGLPRR